MARGKRIGGLRYELGDITAIEHATFAVRDASAATSGDEMIRHIDDAVAWFRAAVDDLLSIRARVK